MSDNRTILQQHNVRINENNNDLVSILVTINNLPERGGSSATITDADYLFMQGARTASINDVLSLCKNVTSCKNMFYGCRNLTELDLSNFDTSKVTTMTNMFGGCEALQTLNLSGFNTSNVTDMSSMFFTCGNLETLDLSDFDTSNVTNMGGMFSSCFNLQTVDVSNFNTSNVTDMGGMFEQCRNLTDLDLSNFDASNVSSVSSMFWDCSSLTNLKFVKNLGKGFTADYDYHYEYTVDLSSARNLTHESLMDVINNLYDLNLTYDVANGGTLHRQQLVVGFDNWDKLTDEERNIAEQKGWTVTREVIEEW